MEKTHSDKFLEKAKLLSKDETERVLARMRSRLAPGLGDKELSELDRVVIQLELEEEDLREWRAKVVELRKTRKTK